MIYKSLRGIASLKQIFLYRGLLYSLSLRDLQVRYKQSILGIAWAIIQPVALMLMFTLIFSALLKIPSDDIPYPIFIYSALLPWTFFSNSLSTAILSLEANSMLIKKVYFPREIIPISSVLAALFDFLIAVVIFIAMMLYFHVPFTINIVFVVPILLVQIIFTIGMSFFASAINVYYRDVRYALPLIMQLWLYASPVIYSITLIPDRLQRFYLLNPMAGIMDSYRKVLVKGVEPDYEYLGIAAAASIILFIVCYLFFKRIEMAFADAI